MHVAVGELEDGRWYVDVIGQVDEPARAYVTKSAGRSYRCTATLPPESDRLRTCGSEKGVPIRLAVVPRSTVGICPH
jgi:hypothetical protein